MRINRLLRHRMLVIGGLLLLCVIAMALAAELITPISPTRMSMRTRFSPPGSPLHPLGSDAIGRDVLSRLVHGARVSLRIGTFVVLAAGVAGTAIGALAGYFRALDGPLMRTMDALMAFPAILLAIAIAAALGPSEVNVVIALSAVYAPRTARVVRAQVLVLRDAEYVQAARVAGAGDAFILRRHILPNCTAPLIVQLTFVFAYAVLAEAVLSFLGVGPPPPTPTWGNMIADGRNFIREAPWITMMPGIAISITVLGLNLLGDGLRDVLDPRMQVAQA
ncbi:ABC transporter permease [Elioraea sp.]|uniref:ABC transporter permease n=1 Tax=Elioraea sp. TaxID=2185103 RepID=UPI003458CF46